jgi:hypothetical protein
MYMQCIDWISAAAPTYYELADWERAIGQENDDVDVRLVIEALTRQTFPPLPRPSPVLFSSFFSAYSAVFFLGNPKIMTSSANPSNTVLGQLIIGPFLFNVNERDALQVITSAMREGKKKGCMCCVASKFGCF